MFINKYLGISAPIEVGHVNTGRMEQVQSPAYSFSPASRTRSEETEPPPSSRQRVRVREKADAKR